MEYLDFKSYQIKIMSKYEPTDKAKKYAATIDNFWDAVSAIPGNWCHDLHADELSDDPDVADAWRLVCDADILDEEWLGTDIERLISRGLLKKIPPIPCCDSPNLEMTDDQEWLKIYTCSNCSTEIPH